MATGGNGHAFALATPQCQLLFPVEPVDTLVIDPSQPPLQQDMQSSVAPAAAESSEAPQPCAELRLILTHLSPIAHGAPSR